MNRFLLGMVTGVFFSITSAAIAADTSKIEALILKSKYLFNGNERSQTSLNLDGTIYAPIRFISDNTGSIIYYDDDNQTINVNYPSLNTVKSELNSNSEDDKFILSLYSEKNTFKQSEYVNVWASLRFKGETSIHLTHNDQIISFYIIDEKGNRAELGNNFMIKTSVINKGDEFKRTFPSGVIQNYNVFFHKASNGTEAISKTLPLGQYKIGVTASYLRNSATYYETGAYASEETKISTELPIIIE